MTRRPHHLYNRIFLTRRIRAGTISDPNRATIVRERLADCQIGLFAFVKLCPQKPTSFAHRLTDSRGSSLVEFSLVAFMLLMVIFGVVEISRLVIVYTDVANAAREGTRYASVHGFDTTTDIQTVTQNALKAAPMNAANATITVTSAGAIGGTVSVTVAYPYDPLTTYFPLIVTLRSTSEGVIVY